MTSGEGTLSVLLASRRCAAFCVAVLLMVLTAATPSLAAGAFAVGKCGAYGQAFDYRAEDAAVAAAQKQCKGDCTVLTMRRACAAFAIDMVNPCGALRLRGEAEDLQLAQRSHPQVLRVRRQGMRDPGLGLRRQGISGDAGYRRISTAMRP